MPRILPGIALLLALFLAAASPAFADSNGAATVLTEKQAAEDARVLVRALKALHPALTKYRTQAQMDAAFERFETRARAARDAGQMYLAATELAAYIRCGHTWTNVLNQSGAAKDLLLDSADKLPLRLTLVGGRWLVLSSADPAVAAGDELLAIDGIPGPEIVARMLPYLRADGSSDGKRLRQLGHDRDDYSQMDIVWPLLSPPIGGYYNLQVRGPKGAQRNARVRALSLAERDRILKEKGFRPASEEWSFRIDKNVGYLTLPTFSFWRSSFNWSAFITDAFKQLDAGHVSYLVIDIRANEGGDGAIGGEVLSHLLDKPFVFRSTQTTSTYERVPYELVRYLDTWDYSFFDRTGQVEKITEGTAAGKYRLTTVGDGTQTIVPAAPIFRGRAFLLVSAENSSATFQFAMLAQQSHAATLVGQRTGGNLRGLNGGNLAWVTLPNSGVAVDIPLLAGTYTEDVPDASVTPEIQVLPTLEARRPGRDLEYEAVLKAIASGK